MDTQAARQLLLDKRRELETTASQRMREAMASGTDAPARADQTARAVEEAALLAMQRRREVELARISAALRRIDEDEYGYCIRKGDLQALFPSLHGVSGAVSQP